MESSSDEVKRANDYVRTAQCLSRVVPGWSVLVTLLLPVASHFVPQLSGVAHSVPVAVGILKAYGWHVDKSSYFA